MLIAKTCNISGKSVSTPIEAENIDDSATTLPPARATIYRACVARGNYMSQDRSDCQCAVKELSRSMSNPSTQDEKWLHRFARYLLDKSRHEIVIKYQANFNGNAYAVNAWSDTDFAGCKVTRKSTSGGTIQLGTHTI